MDAGGLPVFPGANQANHLNSLHLQQQQQQAQQHHLQQQQHQQNQQLSLQQQQQMQLINSQHLHLQQQQQVQQQQQQQGELIPAKRQAVFDRLKRRIETYRRRQTDCTPRFEQTFNAVCEQQGNETSALQKKLFDAKNKRKKAEKKQSELPTQQASQQTTIAGNLQSSVHVVNICSFPKCLLDGMNSGFTSTQIFKDFMKKTNQNLLTI